MTTNTTPIGQCPGSGIHGLGLSKSATHDECIYCGRVLRMDNLSRIVRHGRVVIVIDAAEVTA